MKGGIGKHAGDDATEDGDDFGDGGAFGVLGDFLAEHGGDLLYDGVPDGFGELLVGRPSYENVRHRFVN